MKLRFSHGRYTKKDPGRKLKTNQIINLKNGKI